MRFGWVAGVVGSIVFFTHYVVTFMSWSGQPGHAGAKGAAGALTDLWPILSCPLFTLLPDSFTNLNWSITLFFNSAVWGAAAYLCVVLLGARRR
jgi:hypothetical protein